VLAELHLLEYQQAVLEYLQEFQKKATIFQKVELAEFMGPNDPFGYNDKPITDDLITDVLLEYTKCTRRSESTNYLQTLYGEGSQNSQDLMH